MGSWTDPHSVFGISHGSTDSEIKAAYRRALLAHHPDKVQNKTVRYTIDDINKAYREILSARNPEHGDDTYSEVLNFNEVVDLGDFNEYSSSDGSYHWSKSCRCGNESGYLLHERDLELNGDADEIAVQCAGCSIWILVQYDVE